ncbi:hypothetical protein Acsp01_13180 [Actinoplanes sp. NBRC 101535]|nr:hypothetical protein Acsp01_13180 [Actinoplanes sp. NBRC 101535]
MEGDPQRPRRDTPGHRPIPVTVPAGVRTVEPLTGTIGRVVARIVSGRTVRAWALGGGGYPLR